MKDVMLAIAIVLLASPSPSLPPAGAGSPSSAPFYGMIGAIVAALLAAAVALYELPVTVGSRTALDPALH
jgi:hypothetical protein